MFYMLLNDFTYPLLAIVIWFIGFFHAGKYVRPIWKIPGKFLFYIAISYALSYWYEQWSLIFILGHPLIGLIFHINACKKNGINWINCEPKNKYLELQEKWAKGDFS